MGAPVAEGSRIGALDAARGFALLGIFFVNIQSFGDALGHFLVDAPPEGAPSGEWVSYYFVKVFCEGKFYPLFSMMFGMGLVLQTGRLSRQRSPVPVYARRLVVLGLIALAHALFLWYGDILFLYSLAGAVLLVFWRARPRTLLWLGGAFLALALVTNAATAVMTYSGPRGAAGAEQSERAGQGAQSAAPADAAYGPKEEPDSFGRTQFGRLLQGFKDGTVTDPTSPVWIEAETEAYRDGPWVQAFCFRALTWLVHLAMALLGYGWHVLAMFFLGAALVKLDVFAPHRLAWHRRFVPLGFLVGLPLSAAAAFLPLSGTGVPMMVVASALDVLGGPLMALGYLGAVTLLCSRRAGRAICPALANVGRLGLTNYLAQSVIATGIFYWWGLGLFGQTTRVERMGIVVAVYAVQVIWSWLWLRAFSIGPMEWLWRTLTYLRVQPMLRRSRQPA